MWPVHNQNQIHTFFIDFLCVFVRSQPVPNSLFSLFTDFRWFCLFKARTKIVNYLLTFVLFVHKPQSNSLFSFTIFCIVCLQTTIKFTFSVYWRFEFFVHKSQPNSLFVYWLFVSLFIGRTRMTWVSIYPRRLRGLSRITCGRPSPRLPSSNLETDCDLSWICPLVSGKIKKRSVL